MNVTKITIVKQSKHHKVAPKATQQSSHGSRHALAIFGMILMLIGFGLTAYSETYQVSAEWAEYFNPNAPPFIHPAEYVTIYPFWQLGAAIVLIGLVAVIVDIELKER